MSVMFLKHWVRTSDAGMSVENVPAVVNIEKRKGLFIGHNVLYCVDGGCVEECGKEGKCC